jgi:murein DD-endopeptidase MepM/ murein hydrolase activator NlpD
MLRPINELGPTTPSVYQIAPNIGAMLLLKRFLDDNFHYYKGSWIALTQEVAASPLWYGITQNPHYKRILHDYYGGRQLIVTLLHTNGTGFYRTKKIYHQSRLQTDVLIFNQLLSEDTKWSFSQKGDIASGTLPLVTSGYGRRKGSHHSGFDIGGPKGTSVYAVTDGKVTFAGWENYKDKKQGYGRFVQISHPDGKKTVYAHLDSFAVKRGDRVKGGQKIGETDNSGHIMSGDSHLHFEIISNGRKVNPGDYLNTDFDYRRAVSPMYSLISAGASRVDINRKEVIV